MSIIGFYFFTSHNDENFKVLKRQKLKDSIIKDARNLFRLKMEINDTAFKDVRNIFRLKQEIDYTTVKDIRNIFGL